MGTRQCFVGIQCAWVQRRSSGRACKCRVQGAHHVASAALVAKVISGRYGGTRSSRCWGRAVPAAHLLAWGPGFIACILLATVLVILCRGRLRPCRRQLVRRSVVAVSWIPGPCCYTINPCMNMICNQPERRGRADDTGWPQFPASCGINRVAYTAVVSFPLAGEAAKGHLCACVCTSQGCTTKMATSTQSALLWVAVGRLLQGWPAIGQRGRSVWMRLAVATELGRLITLQRLVGLVGLVGGPRTGRLPGGRTRSTHASRVSSTGGGFLLCIRPGPLQNARRPLGGCWVAATGRGQGLVACRRQNLLQARYMQPEQHLTRIEQLSARTKVASSIKTGCCHERCTKRAIQRTLVSAYCVATSQMCGSRRRNNVLPVCRMQISQRAWRIGASGSHSQRCPEVGGHSALDLPALLASSADTVQCLLHVNQQEYATILT